MRAGNPEMLARMFDKIANIRRFRWTILCLPLFIAGCISPVDYGKIPHATYVSDPRCNPGATNRAASADKPFFLVTSRLPDCRTPDIKLLSHRSDQVRFGRFDGPRDFINAKGKERTQIPFSFTNEAQWWDDLSKQMDSREGRVLLYVHGFRETFFISSKDTAQMARLTDFMGPVIQYSWPSQGRILKYVVDETNMTWSQHDFRKFLMKLAQQPWTREIVLVSHSLGARLVLPAVAYVDRHSANANSNIISNIILASPDIDAQNFEHVIAEEILSVQRVNNGRRITVYASAKDKAIGLSADIHGYPRLGSPRCFDPFEAAKLKGKGLPERCYAATPQYNISPDKSALTIIDTTAVSKGGNGHSDFLRSAAACKDFTAVVNGESDRKTDRNSTHLSHVFTLAPAPKGQEPDDIAVCRREK